MKDTEVMRMLYHDSKAFNVGLKLEERAKDFAKGRRYTLTAYEGYIAGATEQKSIDEEEIRQLNSIMEKSASVLGIGTKWFNEDGRRAAIAELKQEILNYLSD